MAKKQPEGQVFVSPSGKDRVRTADPGSANVLRAQGYVPEKTSKGSGSSGGGTTPTAASNDSKAGQGSGKKASESKSTDKK